MKAKDIDATTHYLMCPAQNWRTNTYTGTGYGATKRVVVLEGPAAFRYNTTERAFERVTDGSTFRVARGYLVSTRTLDTGEPIGTDVVSGVSIRGPWDELWPAIQAAETKRRAEHQAQVQEREAEQARVLRALEVIEYRTGLTRGMYPYNPNRAVLHLDVLEAVAALLEDRK